MVSSLNPLKTKDESETGYNYALRDNVLRLRMQQNIEPLVSSLNFLKTKGKSETGYNYTLSESRMSDCKLEHQEIRKAILSTQLRQFALFLLLF